MNNPEYPFKFYKSKKLAPYKQNLYFTVYLYLLNGLKIKDICLKLKISKYAIQYYLTNLSTRRIIKRIGYGVYECANLTREEFFIKLRNEGGDTPIGVKDLPKGMKAFKRHLKAFNIENCLFCNSKYQQLHHLKPKFLKGKDFFLNLIPVCKYHHYMIHYKGTNELDTNKITQFQNKILDYNISGLVRGHAFQLVLKLPNIPNWNKREEIFKKENIDFYKSNKANNGGIRIIKRHFKIWLYDNSIIFYTQLSYINKTALESKRAYLYDIFKVIEDLERKFKTQFRVNSKYMVKISRQHYSHLKNELAKDYNDKGKKLFISDENGLWLLIDYSCNIDELETVHSKTAGNDMDKAILPFFNDLKQKPILLSEITNLLNESIKTNRDTAELVKDIALTLKIIIPKPEDIRPPKDNQESKQKEVIDYMR
jgi:hypothetical protein